MVAGRVVHVAAFLGLVQDRLKHARAAIAPLLSARSYPAINDVAHQVKVLAFDALQEALNSIHLGPNGTQVNIGNENRSIALRRIYQLRFGTTATNVLDGTPRVHAACCEWFRNSRIHLSLTILTPSEMLGSPNSLRR